MLGGANRRKLLAILDSVSFSQECPPKLELQFFDAASLDQVMGDHEQRSEEGILLCDVEALQRTLMTELNTLQGCNVTGQRRLIAEVCFANVFEWGLTLLQEVDRVCRHCFQRNQVRHSIHAKRMAFEAWRQVVEVVLSSCPDDLLSGENRLNLVTELLQDLLVRVHVNSL